MSLPSFAGRALALLLLAAPAVHAQAFRTYLSSTGVDGPACNLAAPCRLLPAALAAVADGGEVWILDSANYNTATVTVSKSVTILAVPGALGSLVATAGSAMVIGTPGVEVALRNLVVVPLPGTGATHGVSMYAGAALTVQDCTFANLPHQGVYAENGMVVRVIDSTFRDNGGDGLALKNGVRATVSGSTFSGNGGSGVGVLAASAAAVTAADISDSVIEGNVVGLFVRSLDASAVSVSIRSSYLAGNGTGVTAYSYGGGPVNVSASGNLISNTLNHGLDAYQAGSRIWASGNTIVNTTGPAIRNSGGIVETAGDNALRHNASSANGTVDLVGTQ